MQAALADVVTSTDVDWLALCRTDLAEASAIFEAAMAVRAEAADVNLGRESRMTTLSGIRTNWTGMPIDKS